MIRCMKSCWIHAGKHPLSYHDPSVLFYGGCGLSAVFVIIAASLIVWALRNINHLETL